MFHPCNVDRNDPIKICGTTLYADGDVNVLDARDSSSIPIWKILIKSKRLRNTKSLLDICQVAYFKSSYTQYFSH